MATATEPHRSRRVVAGLVVAATALGVLIVLLAGGTAELKLTRLSEEVVGAFILALVASLVGAALALFRARVGHLAYRGLVGAFLGATVATAATLVLSRLGMQGVVLALPPLFGALGTTLGRIAAGDANDHLGARDLLGSMIGALTFVALPHAIGGPNWSLYGIAPLIVGLIVVGTACLMRALKLRRRR